LAGVSWIGPGAALLVGVYADLAFNLFSAMNSSPQTTELFADDRAETLWKYVKIADAAAVGFGLLGTLLDGTWWPLAGALLVVGIMHWMYRHALSAGTGKQAPA
jgi:hypothetical protein